MLLCTGYDFKLHPVTNAQFSTIEVLVAMLMTRWEFRIVPCLTGGNASATCLKMPWSCVLPMCNDLRSLSLHRMFNAQYKCQVIIIIIIRSKS